MHPLRFDSGWTPNFAAGAAEMGIEAVLTRFHLVHRAATVGTGALRLVAHPEETERRPLAWAALAVEAGSTVVVWSHTRRWPTMRTHDLWRIDTALGVVAVALGARSATTDAQAGGTAWTNRVFDVRMAATPLLSTSATGRATSVVVQALPLVVGRSRADALRILAALAPTAATAAAPTILIANRLRRHATLIDEHVSRFVDRRIDDELATERAAFELEILMPAASALRRIGDALTTDPRCAAALAADEEARIRRWLSDPDAEIDAPLVIETVADYGPVERTARRISRRVRAAVCISTSVTTLVRITHSASVDRRVSRAAIATTGLRCALAAALLSDSVVDRLGENRAEALASAANLASAAALGRVQARTPGDRRMSAWIEADSAKMAATVGIVRWDAPSATSTVTALGAIRGLTEILRRGPWRERLAGAANEQLVIHSTAHILRNVARISLEQTRELTAMSTELAAAGRLGRLREQRLAQRSLVHDGIAQVLGAVVAGDLDANVLGAWIDEEIARIGVAIDGTERKPASIGDELHGLAAEFGRRGLNVVVEQSAPVPHWTRTATPTVTEIVREALNNVAKHTDRRSATVAVESVDRSPDIAADGAIVVRVTDGGDERSNDVDVDVDVGVAERVGSGVGTRSMAEAAASIGASIDWIPRVGGGTEVRLVLDPSAPQQQAV